jgi:hypothetical protein
MSCQINQMSLKQSNKFKKVKPYGMLLHLGVHFPIFLGESSNTITQIDNAFFDQDGHLIKKKMKKRTASDKLLALLVFSFNVKLLA